MQHSFLTSWSQQGGFHNHHMPLETPLCPFRLPTGYSLSTGGGCLEPSSATVSVLRPTRLNLKRQVVFIVYQLPIRLHKIKRQHTRSTCS